MIPDAAAFIRAHTRPGPVPHAPEIRLHMADEATELWQKTEKELDGLELPPPFWAFPWLGGQALARYILDHPQRVQGRVVLDFASGSGLVAIAAARAGAARVIACDIDAFAIEAIRLNAMANGVAIEAIQSDLVGRDEGWEVVLAGDIWYEGSTADRVSPWLRALADRGAQVLLGDPGRSYLPVARLEPLASYEVPVVASLEDAALKRSSVWRFR